MGVPPSSNSSPTDHKRALLDHLKRVSGVAGLRIPKLEGPEIVSLSQRQLWLLEQASRQGPYPYNQSASLSLTGPLELAALDRALNTIVQRHATLRTSFELVDGNLVPRTDDALVIRVQQLELTGVTGEAAREAALEALAWDEARRRFDLSRGPLVRATLVGYTPAEHALVLTFHHIAVDGLSLHILLQELVTLYGAFVSGQRSPLAELRTQYRDFAAWQQGRLQGEALAREVAFWTQELAGELATLDLPLDRARTGARSFRGAREELRIARPLVDAITEIGRDHGATRFMVLLAAYNVLLYRYSGQDDIVVGSPSSGRVHGDLDGLIGCFINQLSCRTAIDARASFGELLRQVSQTGQRVMAHQELPFEMLVAALGLPRHDHNPVFQTLFGLQDTAAGRSAGGVVFGDVVTHNGGTSKFDLELNVFQRTSGLVVCFDYDTDVLDAQTVARMLRHYVRILEQIALDPAQRVGELALLDDAERAQVVVEWNATAIEYPKELCVHELFAAQAARTPDRVAVVFEGTRLSYRELDERSNQLAHRLRRLGVARDVLVALCLERSPEMIVGLLGVLKAGGAYVPLDPAYPRDRLAFMLSETRPAVVLTQEGFEALVSGARPVPVIFLDRWGDLGGESALAPAGCSDPDALMYVMYTSGSTGRPKGVMLDHRGVTNRVVAMQRAYVTQDDVVLHKTPYTFDVAVGETFCPLIAGARLVLARPDGHRDSAYVKQMIEQHAVTVTEFVPSMLQVFLGEPGVTEACRSLRLVIASGEALSRELQDRYFALLGGELHNVYGPTEAGEVTAWACRRDAALPTAGVPIGTPMANFQIYLLDAHGRPVPIGARGELYIGGVGLARGYLHRPDLTAERFAHNPIIGARLYRTGDLARYRADGVIEYLGRADTQVKIRGVRIELGEIEALVMAQPGIDAAVVVAREDRPGDKRLVAYVVAHEGCAVSADDLRAAARRQLPDVMVPSAFVMLDGLPLTRNGKVDRNALPAPSLPGAGRPVEAPRSETEIRIAALWAEVLGVDEVGVHDDFFELGGNSLLVVQIAFRIHEELGVEIPQQELFEAPTVRELAAKIDDKRSTARALVGRIPQTDDKVAQAHAILADPSASPAAKLGAERFLEALHHG